MHPHTLLLLAATAALLGLGAGGCSKPAEAPAAASATATSSSEAPVANVSDIDVTEHVKTVLHQSPLLAGHEITVVTLKGDVRLTGTLDNQAQIDEALRIARAAEGSHTIHDELTVKK